VNVTVFARLYEQVASLLVPDRIVLMRAKVDRNRRPAEGEAEAAALLADQVWAFEDTDPEGWSRSQVVHVSVTGGMGRAALVSLDEVLSGHPGEDVVVLHVDDQSQSWELELPRRKVAHSDQLMGAVELLLGPGSYRAEVVRRKAPERRQFVPRVPAPPAPQLPPGAVG
ncbi:MAG: hypothetical protein M3010_08485, partial [Candidatus Dormibacteraeota bacterium]|nr:hypothetical protein [Candidatus Dormibacteraeota bacterium]